MEKLADKERKAKAARRNYMKKYRQKNQDAINEWQREWRRKNPDKVRQYNQSYWEKKANEQPTLEDQAIELRNQGYSYREIGKELGLGKSTVSRIINN